MTIDLVTGLAEITAEEEDAPKKSGKRYQKLNCFALTGFWSSVESRKITT
jgi:hypothetical protein